MNNLKKWIPLLVGALIGANILQLFIDYSKTGNQTFIFFIPVLFIIYIGFLYGWKKYIKKDFQ